MSVNCEFQLDPVGKSVNIGLFDSTTGKMAVEVVLQGSGYTVGQLLSVSGGAGFSPAVIYVDSVVPGGGIDTASLFAFGAYTTYPTNPVSVGVGSAQFNLPGAIFLPLANCGGKILTVQTMQDQSKVLASSDFVGGGGGAAFFKFASSIGFQGGSSVMPQGFSWVVGHSFDGTTTGSAGVNIAMPSDLWPIYSEVMTTGYLAGTEVRYDNSDFAHQHRYASWTVGKLISDWGGPDPKYTISQYVTPEYNTSRIITAIPAPLWQSIGSAINMIDISPKAPAWDPAIF